MASGEAAVFTEEELAELDRRLAEHPSEYATEDEVAAAFERTASKESNLRSW